MRQVLRFQNGFPGRETPIMINTYLYQSSMRLFILSAMICAKSFARVGKIYGIIRTRVYNIMVIYLMEGIQTDLTIK